MRYRKLGKTGFEISEISLGTWQVGGKWGEDFNKNSAEEIVHAAIDAGVNFIDTADHVGFINDPNTASESVNTQGLEFTKHYPGCGANILTVMHGHGFGSHPLQGSLNLSLPGLGFSFLKVEETSVSLFENLPDSLQYLIFFLRKGNAVVITQTDASVFGQGD